MIKIIKRKPKRNPKNEYLLSDLKIRKSIFCPFGNTKFIIYSIFYRFDNRNKLIGKAFIRPGDNFVSIVEIDKDYRRQGVNTFLYDYIEKDLGIKLKPVKVGLKIDDFTLIQEPDGKAFWENRLKKKNPKDEDFLKKVKIEKEIFKIKAGKDKITSIQYNAYLDNNRIGYAEIVKGQNTIDDIDVIKKYQRKGLATFLHNYVEEDLGIKLEAPDYLMPDGKKFWENRNL